MATWRTAVEILLFLSILYVGVSLIAYSFYYPHLTRTEVVLDLGKALTWKWLWGSGP